MKGMRALSLALGSAISLAALASPAMAAPAEPFQVNISGATAAPQTSGSDPANGIMLGGYCSAPPDGTAVFDKSEQVPNVEGGLEPNHVVFAVQLTPQAKSPNAVSEDYIVKHSTVNVTIYGANGQSVETINLPLLTDAPDIYTKNQFLVNCVWLNPMADQPGLAPGDYTYKFQATITGTDGKTHTRTWVPENNTFTVIDSANH